MKPFESRLAAESQAWVQTGLITAEQRGSILALHPETESSSHRLIAILGTIGGLLVVAGIGLVIAAHWQSIHDWVKIIGLLVLLGAAHVAGWRLRIAPGSYPKTGDVFFLIGCVLFLLGIVLISQVFHLNSRPPNGILLWWLGIVALPWLLRVKSAQFVSVVALLTWLGMELGTDDSWLRVWEVNSRWEAEHLYAAAFLLLGAALFFSGIALRRGPFELFSGLHEKCGLLLANAALYSLTFKWSRHFSSHGESVHGRWLPFVLFGAVTLLLVALAVRRCAPEDRGVAGWWLPSLIPVFGFAVGVGVHGEFWWWGAASCGALFVLNIGMIRAGLASGRESWINLGVGFIALNIITRYIDLFGTMMEGGVFFLVTGVLVLGLGILLERKRRVLVAKLRSASS